MGDSFLPRGGSAGIAHLSNYTVEYRTWGEGPPIVLIHGLAGGIKLLGPLAKALSRNFRVICYQQRGEDNCFAVRQGFGLPDLVGDLREFIDWMCLERPALYGVSFGGIVALEYAARYSNSLERLIVQGVGARFQPSLLQRIAGTVLSRFPLPDNNPFVNQFFNLLFGKAQKKDELFDFVTRQCWATDQSVMSHRFQLVESYNLRAHLRHIRVPSLILHGEKDILVSQRNLLDLCNGIPEARLLRLPQLGHLGFVTDPELVASKISQFVPAAMEASAS
jgi:pimeloyl-ACP methyl ester carboxylesterase